MGLTADDTWPALDGEFVPDAGGLPCGINPETTRVGDWAARSEAGPSRDHNEDRWGHQCGVRFALADGMGGHSDGERAATIVRDGTLEGTIETWPQLLRRLNDQVRHGHRTSGRSAGTTLVALEVHHGRATVVSVGDSRVYRCRSGRLEQLTEDHTLRGDLMSAGIDADRHADARESRGLTSYLGIDPARLRIDVIDVPVAAGDRFLLCSDGIHDMVPPHTMAALLARPRCDDVIGGLFDARTAAGGRDDATAIVLHVT